ANFASAQKTVSAHYSTELFTIKENKKGNYSLIGNNTQKEVLNNLDTIIFNERANLYIVRKNKKYGVISARANVMIPIIYDKITSMGGGVFAGLWEIETNKGKGIYQIGKGELVPAIYSEIDFSSILDSEFIVKADNKYGVYNFKGNLVHPIEYD